MYDAHLCNGEYLVVYQLRLPQVVVQRGFGLRSIVNDPTGGRSGGYLPCSHNPLKVVLDESPGDGGRELKTSVAGESVDTHYAGWALGDKRDEDTVLEDVQWPFKPPSAMSWYLSKSKRSAVSFLHVAISALCVFVRFYSHVETHAPCPQFFVLNLAMPDNREQPTFLKHPSVSLLRLVFSFYPTRVCIRSRNPRSPAQHSFRLTPRSAVHTSLSTEGYVAGRLPRLITHGFESLLGPFRLRIGVRIPLIRLCFSPHRPTNG